MSSTPHVLKLEDPEHKNGAMYCVDTPQGERFDFADIDPFRACGPTEWLWPGRIPYGTVTVIEGAAGSGKTRLAFDLAARMGARLPWPDGAPNEYPAGDVLVVSRHEEAGPAIIRRFEEPGEYARKLVRFHGFWTEYEDGDLNCDRPITFPADLEVLWNHLTMHASIRLVIIDPISEFCATPRLLAETLYTLHKLAKDCQVAIIVTVPANCRTDRDGRLKVTSRWPTDVARWVWSILTDPDDPSRRLLAARRMNFCREPDGLAFRLTEDGVEWEADSKVSPDDPAGHLTGCQLALREMLRGGALPARTIYRLGAELGFSSKQLRTAAKDLRADIARVGFSGEGHWQWALPSEASPEETVQIVRQLASQILSAQAMPGRCAVGENADAECARPIFGNDGRVEFLLDPAVERIPAAAPVAAADAAPGTADGEHDEGANAEIPASQPSEAPAVEQLAGDQSPPSAPAGPDDSRGDREMPVDQVSDSPALSGADIPRAAGQVRPLSKRKAKRARQKLARSAARLQQTRSGSPSAAEGARIQMMTS
jgi:hypothetical protein